MLKNIKNKIMSKKGASDIVVVLIIIVIFAAVSYYVFSQLGSQSKSAGDTAKTQVGTTVTSAASFANGTNYPSLKSE